jgi:hypothetical protein
VLEAAADLRAAGPRNDRSIPDTKPAVTRAGPLPLAGQAEDDVADSRIGVGEGRRRGACRIDLDDREVAVAVDAADGSGRGATVAERHGDLVTAQVVGVGQDAAVGDDDAATADPAADPDDGGSGRAVHGADRGGELFEGGHVAGFASVAGS